MPAEIEYKASVERDLRRIDRKQRGRILDKLEDVLEEDPGAGEALKGEYKGQFKLLVGDCRVIYARTGKGLLVLRISHRGGAY